MEWQTYKSRKLQESSSWGKLYNRVWSTLHVSYKLRLLTDTPHDFLDQPIGLLCHTFPHVWDQFNAFTLKSDRFIGLSV